MAQEQSGHSGIQQYNESLTPEEWTEHQRQAGLASGRARRKYKAMRETLRQFMDLAVDDEKLAERLRKMGLDPSVSNAVGLSVVKKAVAGEVTAVRFLRDTMENKDENQTQLGDRPLEAMDLSRLTDSQLAELADREE